MDANNNEMTLIVGEFEKTIGQLIQVRNFPSFSDYQSLLFLFAIFYQLFGNLILYQFLSSSFSLFFLIRFTILLTISPLIQVTNVLFFFLFYHSFFLFSLRWKSHSLPYPLLHYLFYSFILAFSLIAHYSPPFFLFLFRFTILCPFLIAPS